MPIVDSASQQKSLSDHMVRDSCSTDPPTHSHYIGMFLLARLVMDNLMAQDCEEDLKEELNNKILPHGINEA